MGRSTRQSRIQLISCLVLEDGMYNFESLLMSFTFLVARICPGRHFAINTLMIYAASVLHVYNITPGTDAAGNPIRLTTEFVGGIIS